VTTVLESTARREPPAEPRPRSGHPAGLFAGAGTIIAAGLFLRFFTTSHLWLDEALSVNIARLPMSHLVDALRHDGAPPLYYAVLHLWMRAFGGGDVTVRALSGLFAVATVPAIWFAGRRLGGPRAAWVSVVLLAASPFATHYATEARMYALVTLLSALGLLAVLRALDQPTLGRLALVALDVALLLYSHYWSLYLVAVAFAVLAWRGWRKGDAAAKRVVGALVVGGLAFVPWLPVLAYQAKHTGTPWASPSQPWRVFPNVLGEFAGGPAPESPLNFMVLVILLALGLFARALDRSRIDLDLRTRPPGRWLAILVAGTIALAVLAGYASHVTFQPRYTAGIFPLFVLWVAIGALAFADRRVLIGVVAATCLLSLGGAAASATAEKSQGAQAASILNAQARPGDVVVYCPDQLGPAASRYIRVAVDQLTWPAASGPDRIDWVDYRKRIDEASPAAFAAAMVARAGPRDVWLVWGDGYSGLGQSCPRLQQDLALLRPAPVTYFEPAFSDYEHEGLVRYPAAP
jgi:4-amino-4-deoxy-L-arabinose transferase-like glycosyltransferase